MLHDFTLYGLDDVRQSDQMSEDQSSGGQQHNAAASDYYSISTWKSSIAIETNVKVCAASLPHCQLQEHNTATNKNHELSSPGQKKLAMEHTRTKIIPSGTSLGNGLHAYLGVRKLAIVLY